jgi:hypothetical protein
MKRTTPKLQTSEIISDPFSTHVASGRTPPWTPLHIWIRPMARWLDGSMARWLDGSMDRWIDGSMAGSMARSMWLDGSMLTEDVFSLDALMPNSMPVLMRSSMLARCVARCRLDAGSMPRARSSGAPTTVLTNYSPTRNEPRLIARLLGVVLLWPHTLTV